MPTPLTGPLSPGTHTFEVDGVVQRYHVHGTGPVCIAHSGGPGVFWEYLRMPEVERQLTVVYPEPVGTGGSGRLPSHPHGYTRELYSRFLDALVDHLGVPRVHLLGHSHGGFVVQYHALRRPARVAGIVLYDSAPITGPEHGAEAMRMVQEFAVRHAGHPGLPEVLGALQGVSAISDDVEMTAALKGLLPAYFADYWGREEEFAPLRAAVAGTHISGLDEHLVPDLIDDRGQLGALTVPALVVAGRYDVVCGMRWAGELHELIPQSELVVLENSGHFGHLEEPGRFAEAVVGFVTARERVVPA
ncbi:alpha/beta fold hydrolase [Actinacidiphila glaucinigra]|uniref:Tricorn interacting aminopeptidase F1. Serine peptidase. MEROPS family S33 n=1 Tax=Actinacidiphila glaucinigra TaxID=235986 RepID=A0A239IEY0_9ACTN|nr:alpha/beta hydrolase [Actinacidiphila glaucinigra]SNS91818.1 tricorn interacting aminopeptidase F1. Serine peptidase. MEROPS family S33 [Actinacidiphila glaucinigra]